MQAEERSLLSGLRRKGNGGHALPRAERAAPLHEQGQGLAVKAILYFVPGAGVSGARGSGTRFFIAGMDCR